MDIPFKFKVVHKSEKHILVLVESYDLKNANINNWKHNRPPDISRIIQIAENLNSKDYVQGTIHLAVLNSKMYCYDGIHRLSAIKHTTGNKSMLIDIFFASNEKEILTDFININKSIPVPNIFLEGFSEEKSKLHIVNAARKFLEKYHEHASASKNPQIPNENRDLMIDKIYNILEKNRFKYSDFTDTQWLELLEEYNKKITLESVRIKLTAVQRSKCERTGCFLFCKKNWDVYVES